MRIKVNESLVEPFQQSTFKNEASLFHLKMRGKVLTGGVGSQFKIQSEE